MGTSNAHEVLSGERHGGHGAWCGQLVVSGCDDVIFYAMWKAVLTLRGVVVSPDVAADYMLYIGLPGDHSFTAAAGLAIVNAVVDSR